jgi:hypothetical protein
VPFRSGSSQNLNAVPCTVPTLILELGCGNGFQFYLQCFLGGKNSTAVTIKSTPTVEREFSSTPIVAKYCRRLLAGAYTFTVDSKL